MIVEKDESKYDFYFKLRNDYELKLLILSNSYFIISWLIVLFTIGSIFKNELEESRKS